MTQLRDWDRVASAAAGTTAIVVDINEATTPITKSILLGNAVTHATVTDGAWQIYAGDGAPNILAGHSENSIASGTNVRANVIAGGGYTANPNTISGAETRYASINGGYDNHIDGENSTEALDGTSSTIAGGSHNTIQATHSTLAGGSSNTISAGAGYTTIAGGASITVGVDATYSYVGGGYNHTIDASCTYGTIGGGTTNNIGGSYATIGGGTTNEASSTYATVGGGQENTASGSRSTVAGGKGNTASGTQSTVCGGVSSTASGSNSTVLGGTTNVASGDGSIAGGRTATASGNGSVCLADYTGVAIDNTVANSVLMRFGGGYRFTGGDVQADSDAALLFGADATVGSWRIVRSGDDLVIQRYDTDSWVTKSTIAAA